MTESSPIKQIDWSEVAEAFLQSDEARWSIETLVTEYLNDKGEHHVSQMVDDLDIRSMAETEVEERAEHIDFDLKASEAIEAQLISADTWAEEIEVMLARIAELEELVSELKTEAES